MLGHDEGRETHGCKEKIIMWQFPLDDHRFFIFFLPFFSWEMVGAVDPMEFYFSLHIPRGLGGEVDCVCVCVLCGDMGWDRT